MKQFKNIRQNNIQVLKVSPGIKRKASSTKLEWLE